MPSASALLRAAAVALVATAASAFDYSHHGQDWMQGLCSSRERQSPVNFNGAPPGANGRLMYNYVPFRQSFNVYNNGKTVYANLAGLGLGGITHNDVWYNLMNVNFHARGEHTFDGVPAAGELHLVHKKYDSEALLTVAIPVAAAGAPSPASGAAASGPAPKTALLRMRQVPGAPSVPVAAASSATAAAGSALSAAAPFVPPPAGDADFNAAIQCFLTAPTPAEVDGVSTVPASVSAPLDLNGLLGVANFYEYYGSLTAPPCAEIVTWFVRTEPLKVSAAQLTQLAAAVFAVQAQGNARSTMPMNGRPVSVRTAVREEPVVASSSTAPHPLPLPLTDREFRALKWSRDALQEARTAVQQVRSLDERLRAAAGAHEAVLEDRLGGSAPTAAELEVAELARQAAAARLEAASSADHVARSVADAAIDHFSRQASVAAAAPAVAVPIAPVAAASGVDPAMIAVAAAVAQ